MIRALLVDDERDLVSTLAERLAFRGVDAEYALSGAEAVRRIAEKSYDVVVLDLKLPGMSGIDVLEAIRRSGCRVPVIIVTGQGFPAGDQPEIPFDASAFLPKPITIDLLLDKIREAVGGA